MPGNFIDPHAEVIDIDHSLQQYFMDHSNCDSLTEMIADPDQVVSAIHRSITGLLPLPGKRIFGLDTDRFPVSCEHIKLLRNRKPEIVPIFRLAD